MKLTALPDGKFIETAPADKWLTVGQHYDIIREVGNGVVVQANNGESIVVLKDRFE